jgi:hypothetical protein
MLKKDGTLRLYVDYRGLNKVTVRNRRTLPLIIKIMDRITGAIIYFKVDVKEAYYRIRFAYRDKWKITFKTRYGYFEYLVILIGLTNTPATF